MAHPYQLSHIDVEKNAVAFETQLMKNVYKTFFILFYFGKQF